MAALTTFFGQVLAVLSSYRPIQDTLDILLVALIIYELIKLARRTRSVQIFKGLFILAVVYIVVAILDMPVMKYIFDTLFASVLILIVILFTPEIRNVLERMGRSSFAKIFYSRDENIAPTKKAINSICGACSSMSDDKIGALIVFERRSMLGEVVKTGTKIDASVSSALVRNIFYPKSPLHDGALLVIDSRVAYAGCILPLTDTTNLDAKFGTRHRAAVGMTEQTDAVVVVVSEETGSISYVEKGRIKHDITSGELRDYLLKALVNEDTTQKKKRFFGFLNKKGGEQ